jgi:hypothetical protein
MNVPILGRFIDERFLQHRLRSTSVAGIAGALLALGLWAYHFFAQGILNWELFAIAATVAVVKVILMIWYRITD